MPYTKVHQLIQNHYSQALSRLVLRLHNIEQAEDCLQSAVEAALLTWPAAPPSNPVAWLVTTAKHKFIDDYRKAAKQVTISEDELTAVSSLFISDEQDLSEDSLKSSYNDDLLRLIFTSCHPALSVDRQIILSLKHVLGLSVEQIARALVLTPSNVQQRLVRTKHKIRSTGLEYYIPAPSEWPKRLDGVLKTIYLLFNQGYFADTEHNFIRPSLCAEAIRLAELLLSCTHQAPPVAALLALLLHQDARSPARVDNSGNLVLLSEQNRSLWLQDKIRRANQLIIQSLAQTGRSYYGLQAAIAALHNHAQDYKSTDWQQIYQLYILLFELAPSPIIELNLAVAQSQSGQFQQGIERVKHLHSALAHYDHYHITLAGLYFEHGLFELAKPEYQRALTRASNHSQRRFIEGRLRLCHKGNEKR